MTPLRRFATTITPFFVLGACAQLIGLSDYDKGDEPEAGAGGEGDQSSGGSAGTRVKTGGSGGDAGGGTAGAISLGGRPSRGGDSGIAGDPGGETGQGGTSATGGTDATGGKGGTGQGGTNQGGTNQGGTSQGGTDPTGGSAPTGGTNTGGSGGSGQTGGTGTGGSGGSPLCTEITLGPYITGIVDNAAAPYLGVYAFEIDPELGTMFSDLVQLEFWEGTIYDGELTGTFPIGEGTDDANYAFCSRCLLLTQDEGTTREKKLFQTSGSVTVAQNSTQMSGGPNFTLSNVTLREVTIDADNISTPVPNGVCVHLASASFDMHGWNCDPAWYSDADCDCGCGRLDPICSASNDTACDLCWCDYYGYCDPGEVQTSNNWLCN